MKNITETQISPAVRIDFPRGETATNRSDIELLFDGLPEPTDLEVDLKNRFIYWTDRGDPPRGNTVNRASIDADFTKHPTPDILLTHLMEGIGIALDFKGDRDVSHRFSRDHLFRQARRDRKETTARSPEESNRHCLRRNNTKGKMIMPDRVRADLLADDAPQKSLYAKKQLLQSTHCKGRQRL